MQELKSRFFEIIICNFAFSFQEPLWIVYVVTRGIKSPASISTQFKFISSISVLIAFSKRI